MVVRLESLSDVILNVRVEISWRSLSISARWPQIWREVRLGNLLMRLRTCWVVRSSSDLIVREDRRRFVKERNCLETREREW
jgi:hypothetical protein